VTVIPGRAAVTLRARPPVSIRAPSETVSRSMLWSIQSAVPSVSAVETPGNGLPPGRTRAESALRPGGRAGVWR
jgi:hypothetical protein